MNCSKTSTCQTCCLKDGGAKMKSDLFLLVQNEINILILDSGNWENTNCPENRDTGLIRSLNELSSFWIALKAH